MPHISPRLTQPRRWRCLAAAGAAAGLTVAAVPALAEMPLTPAFTAPAASLWTVQAEGGEAGEAGLLQQADPDAAYLAQLTLVEGHFVAALELYRKGQTDLAIELAGHPEAEGMMDEVRAGLAAHGAADVTPLVQAFGAALAAGVSPEDALVALSALQAGFAAGADVERDALKARFDALVVVLKAAAGEYAGSIADGKVTEDMAFHEAHAFVGLARHQAAILMGEAPVMKAAARALDAMAAADEAFGEMSGPLVAADPAILAAVAARVELIASSVR